MQVYVAAQCLYVITRLFFRRKHLFVSGGSLTDRNSYGRNIWHFLDKKFCRSSSRRRRRRDVSIILPNRPELNSCWKTATTTIEFISFKKKCRNDCWWSIGLQSVKRSNCERRIWREMSTLEMENIKKWSKY